MAGTAGSLSRPRVPRGRAEHPALPGPGSRAVLADGGHLARSAFASGMDLDLTTAACVAVAGCLIALIALPSRDGR